MNEARNISRQSAAIYSTHDFYCVKTQSGSGLRIVDPLGAVHYLAPNASDRELGIAVLDALRKSRFRVDDPDFDHYKAIAARYYQWVAAVMAQYGYRNEHDMFSDMKRCSATIEGGLLTIRPSNHDSLEGWSGDDISPSDYVTIDAESTPERIGSALRLAFERCI